MSRFGRQPAADELRRQGIKRGVAAAKIGVKHSVLNNTLAGHQAPSREIREGLVRLLGLPIEELFDPEPLAREQGRRYRQGAMLTAGDDPTIKHRRRRTRRDETAESTGSRTDVVVETEPETAPEGEVVNG